MTRSHHRGLLILSMALVAVLTPGLTKLRLDNSFEIWFPETDPALATYHHYQKQFGSDEVVVLVVAPEGERATSDASLQALEALHTDLTGIDGVATVNSLASIPRFDEDDEFLAGETERFTDLFIKDGAFKLLITMEHRPDLEQIRSSVLLNIDAASRRAFPDNRGVWMAGTGVILNALNTETMAQSALFLPLSYGLILIGLACITRSLAWTALAMTVLTAANVGMFGLMGWLDRPITMITMALPPMALVVTVCSILHLQRRSAAIADAVKPILYAGLTTAGGFFSLAAADMAITRDYGLFAGFIVLLSILFTLTGASFIKKQARERPRRNFLGKAINRAAIQRRPVLAGYLCLVGLSLVLSTGLNVDTYSLGFLSADHRAQTDSRNIESTFGPYVPLEFILNLGHSPDPLDLAEIHELQTTLQQLVAPGGPSFSYVDAVYARDLVREYAPGQDVMAIDPRQWIDDQESGIRITLSVPMSSARELAGLRNEILAGADPLLPVGASLTSTGYLPLYSRLIEQVIEDQFQSLALALVVIFALIACWLRDLRLLAIAITINLGPIVMLLGAMAALNIPLDIATITVAPAMLGLIVDDSIHLLYRYQQARKAGSSPIAALSTRVAELGTTLTLTTVVLVLAFGILGLSSISSIAINGLLMAGTAVLALITDLFVLPGMVMLLERHERDWLRLLGSNQRPAD